MLTCPRRAATGTLGVTGLCRQAMSLAMGLQADFCVPLLCLLAFMMCVNFGLLKRPCRPVLAAVHETDV